MTARAGYFPMESQTGMSACPSGPPTPEGYGFRLFFRANSRAARIPRETRPAAPHKNMLAASPVFTISTDLPDTPPFLGGASVIFSSFSS